MCWVTIQLTLEHSRIRLLGEVDMSLGTGYRCPLLCTHKKFGGINTVQKCFLIL